jgi:hypothetical protein
MVDKNYEKHLDEEICKLTDRLTNLKGVGKFWEESLDKDEIHKKHYSVVSLVYDNYMDKPQSKITEIETELAILHHIINQIGVSLNTSIVLTTYLLREFIHDENERKRKIY